jgi:hypothetical protein
MWQSVELQHSAMPHSTEFFGIARGQNKILSKFTEAIKVLVTVYQKIGHR